MYQVLHLLSPGSRGFLSTHLTQPQVLRSRDFTLREYQHLDPAARHFVRRMRTLTASGSPGLYLLRPLKTEVRQLRMRLQPTLSDLTYPFWLDLLGTPLPYQGNRFWKVQYRGRPYYLCLTASGLQLGFIGRITPARTFTRFLGRLTRAQLLAQRAPKVSLSLTLSFFGTSSQLYFQPLPLTVLA